MPRQEVEYEGYVIRRKHDWSGDGFNIDGFDTTYGFVVCHPNGGNAMPGAVWFQTVKDAKRHVHYLKAAEASGLDFWDVKKAAEKVETDAWVAAVSVIAERMGRERALARS